MKKNKGVIGVMNAREELERIIAEMRFSQKGGWGWAYDNKDIAQAILKAGYHKHEKAGDK